MRYRWVIVAALVVAFMVAAASAADVNAQLRALEAARRAGILNDQEYARKKAELEAVLARQRAKTITPAQQQKIRALDAARQAGILTQQEYARKRAAILAGSPTARPAAAPAVATAHQGATYRHVVGFSFWYPKGWTVKAGDDFLQLMPPSAGRSGGAVNEIYAITGESVAEDGITRPDDPRVIEYMDTVIRTRFPVLKRKGGVKSVPMARGNGILMEWEAKGPTGDTVCARAFVCILKKHGISLMAIGAKKRLDARDAIVRRVFASFGMGEGRIDRTLVGTWNLSSTYGLVNQSPFETDASRARLASDRKSSIVLEANGTWTRTDTHHMIALGAGVGLESKDRKVSKGRWYAGNGELYLIWENNTWEDYKYRVRRTGRGRELRLESAKTGEVWHGR